MRGIEGGRGRRRERRGGSRKAVCRRQTAPAADAVRGVRRARARNKSFQRIWHNRLKCDRMGA